MNIIKYILSLLVCSILLTGGILSTAFAQGAVIMFAFILVGLSTKMFLDSDVYE